MNKISFYIIFLMTLSMSACSSSNKNTLNKSETIFEKYDTIFSFSEKSNNVIIAGNYNNLKKLLIIDTLSKNTIGNIFFYDNGPDYFENGLCRFIKNKKVGFLNKKGEIVVTPKYDYAAPFKNGYAIVSHNCKKVIDNEHTLLYCKKNGLISISGKEILPIVFKSIDYTNKTNEFYVDNVTLNINAYQDSLNLFKLTYGTFYKFNCEFKIFPTVLKNKVLYNFKNKTINFFDTLQTKNSIIITYSNNNNDLYINHKTPGPYHNFGDTSYHVKNVWGNYKKQKHEKN